MSLPYTFEPSASPRGIDIERWTEQAISAMSAVRISTTAPTAGVRGMDVSLEIPLDTADTPAQSSEEAAQAAAGAAIRTQQSRRDLSRRDSMKRREALLRGKEGSRRRQRWENNHLLGNPWLEPPEPRDFEIRPTYPVQNVPYYLASRWDERRSVVQARAAEEARQVSRRNAEAVGKVPKDLRQRIKRSKAAKGMLQDLENQVRDFVILWDEKEQELQRQGLADADSSEDDEIVFVGRNGQTKERTPSQKSLDKDKLIFESLLDDHGAAFGRWLVHSIAAYYNLRTWSRTTGNRREAYVGIKNTPVAGPLPQPLWVSLCA